MLATRILTWNLAKLGLLFLPIFPALGEVGLILALILIWKQKYHQIVKQPFNQVLAILSLWLLVISCFAFSPKEAFLGLANFLPFFAFFAGFQFLIQKPSHLRQLAWLIVIPSLPIVILGVGQLFWGWTTPMLFLGWELVARGNPEERMASVFMYANILALYLLIVFSFSLGLCLDTWRQKNKPPWVICFLTLTLIGDGIGLVFTSSRNAWAIALCICVVFALYLGWHWLVAGVATVAVSILWAAFGPQPGRSWLRGIIPAYFWARLSDEMYGERPKEIMRITQWRFAWELTQKRPFFGWGLRNFTPLYGAQYQEWLGHPHNLPLMLMAETGIPATLILFGLVGWIIAKAVILMRLFSVKREREQLILFTYLVAFASCTLFNLLDVTIFDLRVNTLSWLLLAAIAGMVQRYQKILKRG